MSAYDSISAIGLNPLGGFGLDYTGAYGSYGDPMMTGMMGMNGYPSMMGMGGMEMLGLYNPAFMKQMAEMQQTMEKGQLQHAVNMHDALTQAEVSNLSAHDRAIFQKISVNGDVQREIRILADVIRKGDSDAIIQEYDKLKSVITSKYAEDLMGNKTGNATLNADRYIELIYSQTISQQTGAPADLREDIKKYGETAFAHGFNRTFLGNSGHNKKYSEEVISYIDGNTRINDKGNKDRAEKWGSYIAKGTEGVAAVGTGFAGGVTALGLGKLVAPSKISFFKNIGRFGKFGALALLAGDIFWQMSRSNA